MGMRAELIQLIWISFTGIHKRVGQTKVPFPSLVIEVQAASLVKYLALILNFLIPCLDHRSQTMRIQQEIGQPEVIHFLKVLAEVNFSCLMGLLKKDLKLLTTRVTRSIS